MSNPPADTPLQDFSTCHVGFVTVLEAALGLPEMMVTAARSRSCATDMLKMFHDHLLAHHDDEERDLFPAVLRIAQPGEEALEQLGACVTEHAPGDGESVVEARVLPDREQGIHGACLRV